MSNIIIRTSSDYPNSHYIKPLEKCRDKVRALIRQGYRLCTINLGSKVHVNRWFTNLDTNELKKIKECGDGIEFLYDFQTLFLFKVVESPEFATIVTVGAGLGVGTKDVGPYFIRLDDVLDIDIGPGTLTDEIQSTIDILVDSGDKGVLRYEPIDRSRFKLDDIMNMTELTHKYMNSLIQEGIYKAFTTTDTSITESASTYSLGFSITHNNLPVVLVECPNFGVDKEVVLPEIISARVLGIGLTSFSYKGFDGMGNHKFYPLKSDTLTYLPLFNMTKEVIVKADLKGLEYIYSDCNK